jgi:hypothetical protein
VQGKEVSDKTGVHEPMNVQGDIARRLTTSRKNLGVLKLNQQVLIIHFIFKTHKER